MLVSSGRDLGLEGSDPGLEDQGDDPTDYKKGTLNRAVCTYGCVEQFLTCATWHDGATSCLPSVGAVVVFAAAADKEPSSQESWSVSGA